MGLVQQLGIYTDKCTYAAPSVPTFTLDMIKNLLNTTNLNATNIAPSQAVIIANITNTTSSVINTTIPV